MEGNKKQIPVANYCDRGIISVCEASKSGQNLCRYYEASSVHSYCKYYREQLLGHCDNYEAQKEAC
jgi:hypothetical protein